MKKFILLFVALFGIGCSPLSPQLQQPINNQNGKIDQIENLQNSMKNELLNQKQRNDIQDSQLDRIQNGLINLQSNSVMNGVQILSGPGGLAFALCIVIILGVVAYNYKKEADKNAKTADILAEKVVDKGDIALENEVFKAAMYTDVEDRILQVIKKHQDKLWKT